jgi:hypothetical protein
VHTGIFTVRRVLVAATVLVLVAATVTFDVPHRVWYRLGGDSGTSDLMSWTVVYRVSGAGDKTVIFGTPGGDLTEMIYDSATREVQTWSTGDVARISVRGGIAGGTVGCQILVGDVVEDTDSAAGQQAVANCSARLGPHD